MTNGLKDVEKYSDITKSDRVALKQFYQVLVMKVVRGILPNDAYLRIEA